MKKSRIVSAALLVSLVTAVTALLARRAAAEHFEIAMKAQIGQRLVEASADTTPPIGGVNPRPVMQLKTGEAVQITWKLKSNFPHGTMKGVTIHFFVVREKDLRQKPVPDPAGPAGVLDNRFVMDFSPTASASGSLKFSLPEPGNYLVRVQSEDTHEEHDHEHFSAIDLNVQ